MNVGNLLNRISYLQYPLVAVSLVYYTLFMISMIKGITEGVVNLEWSHLNNTLLFYGVAISMSTLQDTSKTQNKFSKKIWQNPRKGNIALAIMAALAFIFITSGITAYLIYKETILKEVSIGLIVLGIGMIGMLKAASEMFENHRLDKITNQEPKAN